MAKTSWSATDWSTYSSTVSAKPTAAIFTARGMDPEMNPHGVMIREARDSDICPSSTPVIVGLDVTGSMGHIADYMAKTGLGTMVNEILTRKVITDPQVMFTAIGDCRMHDAAPLQIGQFEPDMQMTTWLEKIYLEHGGGGNNNESYDLAHFMAAFHTATDAFEKRNQKGFLITIGDELPPSSPLTPDHIYKIFGGERITESYGFKDLIMQSSKMYVPYHIIVAQGDFARGQVDVVHNAWSELLGQRAMVLRDHTKIAELIVSIMQVETGTTVDDVVKTWSGDTALVVRGAFDKSRGLSSIAKAGVARL